MFLKLDANNDGHLTMDELKAGYKELGSIFHEEEDKIEQMLRATDTNGDGRIDYTEFVAAALEKSVLLSTNNLKNTFRLFDQNGDGTISKDELKNVFGGGHVP